MTKSYSQKFHISALSGCRLYHMMHSKPFCIDISTSTRRHRDPKRGPPLTEHPTLVEIKPLSIVPTDAVDAVLDAAFGPDRFGRTAYRVRQGTSALPQLSFSAFVDDRLVGTLQCWPVELHADDDSRHPLIMVGPVAVLPDVQHGGIGRALMDAMMDAAEAQGDGALMMIGDPEYYQRFWNFTADATALWRLDGPFEQRRLLSRAVNGHAAPNRAGLVGPDLTR